MHLIDSCISKFLSSKLHSTYRVSAVTTSTTQEKSILEAINIVDSIDSPDITNEADGEERVTESTYIRKRWTDY